MARLDYNFGLRTDPLVEFEEVPQASDWMRYRGVGLEWGKALARYRCYDFVPTTVAPNGCGQRERLAAQGQLARVERTAADALWY